MIKQNLKTLTLLKNICLLKRYEKLGSKPVIHFIPFKVKQPFLFKSKLRLEVQNHCF